MLKIVSCILIVALSVNATAIYAYPARECLRPKATRVSVTKEERLAMIKDIFERLISYSKEGQRARFKRMIVEWIDDIEKAINDELFQLHLIISTCHTEEDLESLENAYSMGYFWEERIDALISRTPREEMPDIYGRLIKIKSKIGKFLDRVCDKIDSTEDDEDNNDEPLYDRWDIEEYGANSPSAAKIMPTEVMPAMALAAVAVSPKSSKDYETKGIEAKGDSSTGYLIAGAAIAAGVGIYIARKISRHRQAAKKAREKKKKREPVAFVSDKAVFSAEEILGIFKRMPEKAYEIFRNAKPEVKNAVLPRLSRAHLEAIAKRRLADIETFQETLDNEPLGKEFSSRFDGDMLIEFGRKVLLDVQPYLLRISTVEPGERPTMPDGGVLLELFDREENKVYPYGIQYGQNFIVASKDNMVPANGSSIYMTMGGNKVDFCFSVVVEKVAEREARCYIRNYIAGSSINVSADIYGYRPIGEKNQQAEPTLSLKELQARQAKGQLGAARRSLEDELLMLHIDTELPPDQIEAKRDMEKKLLYTGQALDKYGLCDGLDPQHRKTIEEMLACKYLLMFVGEAELDTILAGFAEKRLPISGLERFVQESILDLYLQDPMREFFTVKTKDELEGFKVDTIILHMLAIFQFDKIKSINNKELVIKRKKLLCDGVLLHIHSRKAKIGSDIRSDIAYRRVVRNILKDRDVEIYQPALEVIIELLATKESLSGYIYDTYMPLLQISEEERGFAEALINLAIKAKSNNVHFFTLSRSDGQRFYETLKNVIKRVANESMLLWRELKDYALEITKAHPNVSKEILAILHECGFGQKELARTQLIAPLNIEKQLNSAA